MTSTGFRVAVIESQGLFAKAICGIFAKDDDFSVVGDYRSPAAAALQRANPDLIILDLDGQPTDVGQSIETCTSAAPHARVCTLSMHLSVDMMQRCFAKGAAAYIVKDASPAELVRAAKTVVEGQSYADPRIAGGLLRRRALGPGKADIMELSPREVEIVKMIAQGLANKEISARLRLSEKTVKNHISRIFSKLNVSARTQAAVHAIRVGLA
jgi:DNA-binding NarL/FixJ family response regulator